MKNRIFNLEDFPDGIYIEVNNRFRHKLRRMIKEKYGTFRKVSKILKIPEGRLNHWLRGERAFNLKMLLKLRSILNLNAIEKEITAYKLASGKKVRNPNLPLIEDDRMFNVIVHFIGDGYANEGQTPEYYNTDKGVRENFKNALKIFGEVEIKEKGNSIYVPTIVIYLLRYFYGVKFGSFNAMLPRELWNCDISYAITAIRVFADDEATVGDSEIRFFSVNLNLLQDVRNLMVEKLSNKILNNGIPLCFISKIRKSYKEYDGTKRILFYFYVTSEGLNAYRELVGFTHTEKRRELDKIIKRMKTSKGGYRKKHVTRKIILEVLAHPKTAKELAEIANIRKGNIHAYHLRKLEKEGLIKVYRNERPKLWVLTKVK